MADDTWTNRDLPVLEAAVRLSDAGPFTFPAAHEIATDTGLDLNQVLTAFRALEQAGLIACTFLSGGGASSHIDVISGGARQLAGSWPSPETFTDRLLAAIEHEAEHAATEDERGRWRKLLDSALGVSRDVFIDVAAAALTKQVPGG